MLLTVGLLLLAAQGVSPDVATIAEARQRAAGVWPGFDPSTIPVLLFDGTTSWLSGHPGTPDGFRPAGRPGLQMYAGRHPEVTANSSVELAGTQTATIMPFRADLTAAARAGVVAHEMFHVFTRQRHRGWTANEVDAFTWPASDAEVLVLRRIEYAMLRHALATTPAQRACFARGAMQIREQRHRKLGSGAAAYERMNELAEGLADYVQQRVAGVADTAVMPVRAIDPENVRAVAYQVGDGLARILDHLMPAWRDTLERRDSLKLDALLSSALPPGNACSLSEDQIHQMRLQAGYDVGALRATRDSTRRALENRVGWRVTIAAGGELLWPQGFDPLNVGVLDSALVVHRRMLRLGNGAGTVEVLGHESVTRAAGEHPLFNGLRSLEVTGLPAEPRIRIDNGVLTLTSNVMSATLRGATAERRGNHITIQLP